MGEGTQSMARPGEKRIGLVSMGFTMVIAGAIMLTDQLGWIDPIGYRWLLPAYLIALGVETLSVRLILNRRDPEVRLVPAGGSIAIMLAVLLIVRLWALLGMCPRLCGSAGSRMVV